MRVGLPKVTDGGAELPFAEGMNTVALEALELLTRHLVATAVAACTTPRRTLAEVHGGRGG